MGKYLILDTTLRDGEQTPGVSITPENKLIIARKLDEIGVDIIEAGSAVVSEGERKAIKMISCEGLNAEICTFCRALKSDIDYALECDVDSIHLVVPSSDLHITQRLRKSREEVKEDAGECVEYAKSHGLKVEFSAEDASRADINFLKELYTISKERGADRICFCDTVGILYPSKVREIVGQLKEIKLPLSFHGHNDFGLATANSVEALLSGASEVHVTVNGLGERAGNAPLEEVVVVLEEIHGIKTGIKKEELYSISRLVSRITKIPPAPTKPIVGENAFTHESGIHVHGIIANASTYEPIPPEKVGRQRRFVVGKHTGRAALSLLLKELKLETNEKQMDEILRRIKELGDKGIRVTDADLQSIVESVMQIEREPKVKLEDLAVVSGRKITPTASIRLKINGKDVIDAGVGVGPVDAAINALLRALKMEEISLVEYHVDAITGGTDAIVEVVIKLQRGDKIITAKGTHEDIIMASVEAFINGINRLI